jgi:serine/threonine protein kinase/tetratricopeptide (TPR) repeat protein
MTIPTGTRLGPYEITDLVGTGGMGEVYRARDTRLGREVAIKILPVRTAADRDRLARFEKEARLASALNHPNIVTIYDIGEAESIPYIAMELVSGQTLRQVMSAGPIPIDRVVDIAVQIADGLAKAHDAGIVHRDLKPENVMITNDGFVKILDFGLGKFRPGDLAIPVTAATIPQGTAFTEPGMIIGTVDYMSPEHAAGEDADFHSDQFSFGSLVYEMTAGQRPFRRPTAVQTMSAIIAEAPAPLTALIPAVPTALRDIIVRCLEKSPGKRYPSTREIVTELRGLSALIQIRGAAGLPHEAPDTRTGIRLWPTMAAVLLITMVFVAGLVFVNLDSAEPLPHPKNVVVLPFRAADSDPESQAFSNGLTDSVTAALTQLTTHPGLQVSPASEVYSPIRPIANAEDARRYAGANLLITGAVERTGESLRVAWNLVEVGAGRQLRTGSITVEAANRAAIENQTIEGILETLELDLSSTERQALSSSNAAIPSARETLLQARGYLRDFDKPENVTRAISLFEQVRSSDSKYAPAYAGLGEAYWRRYKSTQNTAWIKVAQESCQTAIDLDESLPAAHGCLGTVHVEMGRYEDAIKEFQRALRSEPTNDEYRRELARAQERVGRLEDAEQTLHEAIALRPHYWANYNVLGSFYFARSRYAEAAEMFSKVINVAPDNLFGHSNLGGAYTQMGRYADAIPALERSVNIRPTATAYSNLATVYFNRGQFLEAAATFEKATKLDDKNYAIWGNLADAYYWLEGRRAEAGREYRRAIGLGQEALKINPRDATLLSRLAAYHAMLGERQPALGYLKRALAIAPGDASVRFKAAQIHNQFQETELTLKWLESAAQAGFSVTTIRDFKNFDHLSKNQRFQTLLREPTEEKQ